MAGLTWNDIKDLKQISDTTWTRVEGSPRAASAEDALAARLTGGPYWLLAQQWRFGELLGNDAASPVEAAVTWQRRPFARAEGGDDAPDLLEARIEGEPFVPDLRVRIQAGQELARALDGPILADCISAFPLPDLPDAADMPAPSPLGVGDSATRSVKRALLGRVADGYAMLKARRDDTLPQALRGPEVLGALDAVAAWLDRTYPHHGLRPEDSHWSPTELEFRAPVPLGDGGAPAALAVDDHTGGTLDWWSFDLDDVPDFGGAPETTETTLPTPVEFPGMPTSSYWQFEASNVNFGRISAARTDLARLILAEFALIYGEDWFSIPVELEGGGIVRLSDLEVRDSFGETYVIPPAGESSEIDWDIWSTGRPSGPAGDPAERARLLVLASTNATATDGAALEDVILSRDEMANVLWAIERFAANGLGEAAALDDLWGPRLSMPAEVPAGDGLAYTLVTDVPATWHPFSPRVGPVDPAGRRAALERIPFLRTAADGSVVAVQPLGVLLNKEEPPGTYRLAAEAVPRRPLRLVRRFERARTASGRVLLWSTIRRMPAAEHPQSGIRFDSLSDGTS